MVHFKLQAEKYILVSLKNGTLVKPQCCDLCGKKTKSLVAHHQDHSKYTDFSWLCTRCVNRWIKDHEFVLHCFRGDTPKDVIDLTMKQYFRYFHIDTTKTLSTYIGVKAK